MEITLTARDGYRLGAAMGGRVPQPRYLVGGSAPSDIGVRALGHSGFFRERFRDSLWREAADWREA